MTGPGFYTLFRGPISSIFALTVHAAKPRTKWMKNGILGLRSKAGGRFAIKSASLERGQATFEHTELRFDRVH